MGMETPGLARTLELYEELASMGYENDGTQALYRLYDK
jgi:3-hydroxyisobutyrate dehydrogenase